MDYGFVSNKYTDFSLYKALIYNLEKQTHLEKPYEHFFSRFKCLGKYTKFRFEHLLITFLISLNTLFQYIYVYL